MNVLEGPRREIRRAIVDGTPSWGDWRDGALFLGDGRVVSEQDIVHLPPCDPTKILCIHLNYASRAFEFFGENRYLDTPTWFMKPTSSLNGHGGALVRPEGHRYLNYEGELAVVIGRRTRNILPDDAWDHILGFAPANDAGLQDMRDTDSGSMLRTKGADTLCPIGPGLVSGIDVRRETLRTIRNGQVVQDTPIAEMLFGIDYLIADLARHITLLPGDVILSGTPANSRPLEVGDTVEVEVTGIGKLTNHVIACPAARSEVGAQPADSAEVRRVALGNDAQVDQGLRYRGTGVAHAATAG